MPSLLPVAVGCLALLALPVWTGAARNRLSFPRRPWESGAGDITVGTVANPSVAMSDALRGRSTHPLTHTPTHTLTHTPTPTQLRGSRVVWRAVLHKAPPTRPSGEDLIETKPRREDLTETRPRREDLTETRRRGSRGRRHANGRLLRVGCALSTCQVQNLSHRLYQLIGQRGREDSAPIHPMSPHSYG